MEESDKEVEDGKADCKKEAAKVFRIHVERTRLTRGGRRPPLTDMTRWGQLIQDLARAYLRPKRFVDLSVTARRWATRMTSSVRERKEAPGAWALH